MTSMILLTSCSNSKIAQYKSYGIDYLENSNFEEVVLSGRCCESGDIISDSCFLKNPKRGDIIAVYCTGAYNFSMSSNYNKIPKPPIILVTKNGEAKVIVRRQSYEDLISCEID